MNIVEINKVLANETRVKILSWLKEPEKHFPPHKELKHFNDGVCVQYIGEKAGISPSTVSHYLNMLHKIDFILPTRHGKWTYYKRNESQIEKYLQLLKQDL